MAARRPLDDAGRRLSAAARRGAGVLSLRRGAAAGRVVRSLCTLRQDAARGAARRLGGGHQFGIEADLSRPLRARSPAGLSGGRGLRHDCEGSRAPLRDVGRRGRRAGAGHEIQSEILCRGFGGRGDARRGQRRNGDQTRRRRPHRAAPPGRAGEARQAYGIDRNLRCADGYLPPRRLRGRALLHGQTLRRDRRLPRKTLRREDQRRRPRAGRAALHRLVRQR